MKFSLPEMLAKTSGKKGAMFSAMMEPFSAMVPLSLPTPRLVD